MKAQVLHKYDPEMKEKVWVTEQEMPDPKLEKSSDVIVKIGAACLLYTSPSPRDRQKSRMPSSA